MKKKKVLVISGTRAEFSLLESSISSLEKSRKFEVAVLITGMHTLKKFGNTLEYARRKAKISKIVPISEGGNMLSWFTEEILGIASYCKKNRPDCILVLGDRDEPLAAAVVGAHMGIPIAHIHGGDLSGESVIDAKNRNAITQYATFHFPATKKSAGRIKKVIGSSKNIFVVGAPGIDLLSTYKLLPRKQLFEKYSIDQSKKIIIVILHPTWIGEIPFEKQISAVSNSLINFAGEIVWIYPNSDEGSDVFIKQIESFSKIKNVKLFKNLPREDYAGLMANADLMVGNSSSGIIESAYYHLPVVNVGSRQRGRERSSNVIDCGYNSAKIKSAINQGIGKNFRRKISAAKSLYGNGHAGEKIISTLEKLI